MPVSRGRPTLPWRRRFKTARRILLRLRTALIQRLPNMKKLMLVALLVTAPAGAQTPATDSAPLVRPFSAAKPGTAVAPGWMPIKINDQKNPTQYDFVEDQGTVVLHAVADAGASLLGYKVAFDVKSAPVMSWRWKTA